MSVPNEPVVMPSKVHTYTGLWVDPLNLQPDEVRIEDIAHHLSNQCRWTGAVKNFYSVAQHCVLVSRLVPEGDAYDGLMHDSPEYLIQDMAKPLKRHQELGAGYRDAEARLEAVIGPALGVNFPVPESVHEADLRILVTESRDLMRGEQEEAEERDDQPLARHEQEAQEAAEAARKRHASPDLEGGSAFSVERGTPSR